MHNEGLWKVIVGNVSRHANDHYLQEFFSPIGVLHGSALHYPARSVSATGYAELLFARQDEALAAGKLSGWTICNEAIVVSQPEYCPSSQLRPAPLSPPAFATDRRMGAGPSAAELMGSGIGAGGGSGQEWADDTIERKNLYVLNLPIDMTNDEMLKLFQPFGTVVHACILAILDSSARRRGFILMGSGAEATEAMRNLHGQIYRDYVLDVSYSVVQKTTPQRTSPESPTSASGPSAAGGPGSGQTRPSRALSRAQPPAHHYAALRSAGGVGRIGGEDEHDFWSGLPRAATATAAGVLGGRAGQGPIVSPQQQQPAQWDARRPNRIITNGGSSGAADGFSDDEVGLLVDNMSPVVFHTTDDVDALFSAFGLVTSVELVPSLLEDRPNAAVVRFGRRSDAERARRSLEGKAFGGREIRLCILDSPTAGQGQRQPHSAATTTTAQSADWIAHGTQTRLQAPAGNTRESLTPTRLHFSSSTSSAQPGSDPKGGHAAMLDLGRAASSTVFDPFRSPFEPSSGALISSPPGHGPRQLAKDTVELCHPLPTNLARVQTTFPPPPHSFSDTLTPRPHYSSPPPAPARAPKHEGGMGHLRTADLTAHAAAPMTTYSIDDLRGSSAGVVDADELALSDGTSAGSTADGTSFASPDSSLGKAWWRRNSVAASVVGPYGGHPAGGGGHDKTPSIASTTTSSSSNSGGGTFAYFGNSSSSSPGAATGVRASPTDTGALETGFAALGTGESEDALGSSLSSVL